MFVPVLILLTNFFTLPTSAQSKSRTVNPDLNASLKKQATNFDRYAYLSQDTDWQYDFSQHPNYNSQTGAVIVADAASFPALTEQGMTISLFMLAPHLHPRATNLVVAITGNTTTYMVGENGVRTVVTELTSMKMTIFPMGSVHSMQNNGTSTLTVTAYLVGLLRVHG
jgi:oxalate decarboxylase/phosphoglucose isomerase-like protein (cupin superfamily)